MKAVLFTHKEGTKGETALGGNRIPLGYKLQIPIDHPRGGVKEAGFDGAFSQE